MAARDLLTTVKLLNKVIGNMKLNKNQTTGIFSTVFEDNNGSLKFALSPRINPRIKHTETKYLLFRSKVGDGTHIHINRGDIQDNIADIFTTCYQGEKIQVC